MPPDGRGKKKKNHKPCLDTHGQINVRLTQQETYVTQTCKKHMTDKEQQYKAFEAEIFGTCVQTGAKKNPQKCCVHGRWHQLLTCSAGWSNPLKLTCAKSEPSQYLLTLQMRMGIRVHSHLHAHYLPGCFRWGWAVTATFFKVIRIIWVNTQCNNGIKTFLQLICLFFSWLRGGTSLTPVYINRAATGQHLRESVKGCTAGLPFLLTVNYIVLCSATMPEQSLCNLFEFLQR